MAHAGERLTPVVPLELRARRGARARTLVITGPNTGGKTVALKTVGLFVIMNQCGLHVPAGDGTALPVLERHLRGHRGRAVHRGQPLHVLVAPREHPRGTARGRRGPRSCCWTRSESARIRRRAPRSARSILGALTRAGALTIVTTHYGSLKVFAHDTDGMENASLEFDRDSLTPTYRFLQGVPGSSEALSIAARLGLPDGDRRRRPARMLGGEKEAVEGLLHDLQERRRRLDETRRPSWRRSSPRRRAAKEKADEPPRRTARRARPAQARGDGGGQAPRGAVQGGAHGDPRCGEGRTGPAARSSGRARTRTRGDGQGAGPRPLRKSRPSTKDPVHARLDRGRGGRRHPGAHSRGWGGRARPSASRPRTGRSPSSVGSLRVEVPLDSLQVREGGPDPKSHEPQAPARGQATRRASRRASSICAAARSRRPLQEVDRTLDGVVLAGGSRGSASFTARGPARSAAPSRSQLESDDRVKSFRLGEPAEGGSGVTIAVLK